MTETEDEFVRHTRRQWEELGFSGFDEQRCREIYRRTRCELPTEATLTTDNIGEQLSLF
jgi:hypothetical protein